MLGCDVAASASLDELAERLTRLKRVAEQIAGAPVPQIAEEIVERPVTRERIVERFGRLSPGTPWKPLFLMGCFGGSDKGPSRWMLRRRKRTRRRGRSWLRADLRRLRGRDQVRGSKGLASLGPILGAPAGSPGQVKFSGSTGSGAWHLLTPSWVPWCASTTDNGGCGGDPACAYCCGTDCGIPVPQIMPVRGGGTACAVVVDVPAQFIDGYGRPCDHAACWFTGAVLGLG